MVYFREAKAHVEEKIEQYEDLALTWSCLCRQLLCPSIRSWDPGHASTPLLPNATDVWLTDKDASSFTWLTKLVQNRSQCASAVSPQTPITSEPLTRDEYTSGNSSQMPELNTHLRTSMLIEPLPNITSVSCMIDSAISSFSSSSS